MDSKIIKEILRMVGNGQMSEESAFEKFRGLPFEDIGICKHDTHRSLRNEFSEVILCEGKECSHILQIVKSLVRKGINVFGTRVNAETGGAVIEHIGDPAIVIPAKAGIQGDSRLRGNDTSVFNNLKKVEYDRVSKTLLLLSQEIKQLCGDVAIVCAGTADIPVAEEARKTAEFFGFEARSFYDVGVAGIHRLLSCLDDLRKADCVIAVAGMEGALPGVLGGLISAPIVAVPTSVGYGTNLKGFAALLTMLNSCSEGISVVNIDSGFGAACAAARILRKALSNKSFYTASSSSRNPQRTY